MLPKIELMKVEVPTDKGTLKTEKIHTDFVVIGGGLAGMVRAKYLCGPKVK